MTTPPESSAISCPAGAGRHNPLYWDEVAGTVEEEVYVPDRFLARIKREAYLELLARWGGDKQRGSVLKTDLFEEACGRGGLVGMLARRARRVAAFDLSPKMAAAGRKAAEVHGGVATADARWLPFADGAFSLVVSPSTLDHFDDPDDLGRSLRELARVLEPGGRLIVSLDNRQNITDPLLRLVHRLGLVPFYLGRSYRIGELRRELELAGFEVAAETAIVHTPRLFSMAAVTVAGKLGWRWLRRLVRKTLLAGQRLEGTRWKYYTGSFVAALGVKKG